MKIRALRGVCVGVDRHLQAGDTADVDDASVQFLASIGAVEVLKDEPAPVVEVQKPAPAPAKKSGKKEI